MNGYAIFDPLICGRLCLTLLHSLWQVALLATIVWLIDRLVRKQSVERSYALHVGALMLMLLRLFAGILQAHRLACLARPIVEGPLLEMLQNLSRQWSLRVVPLLAKAEHVVVPKVVGLLKPTILLPASALAGLSTDELEMILMHELAHVRRHDLWVNLLQRLAEVALFFNPPLWVLSRRIGTLREYCCDEMTCRAQSASSPETQVRYASALLRIVELGTPKGVTTQDLATLAASGRAPSELRRRVARLFGEPLHEPIRLSRGGLLTLITLGAALTIGSSVWNTRAEVPEDRAGSETNVDAKDNDLTSDFQLHVIGPAGILAAIRRTSHSSSPLSSMRAGR